VSDGAAAPFEVASGDAASLATVPGADNLDARDRRAGGFPFVLPAVGDAFTAAVRAFVGVAAFVAGVLVCAGGVTSFGAASACLATSANPLESTSA